jgi:hypothetical protein
MGDLTMSTNLIFVRWHEFYSDIEPSRDLWIRYYVDAGE